MSETLELIRVQLNSISERQRELNRIVKNGSLAPRWMKVAKIAILYGFETEESPDPNHKALKRFLKEEGIKIKIGTSKTQLVCVAEMDTAMERNRITLP